MVVFWKSDFWKSMLSNSIVQRSLWARGMKYPRRNDTAPDMPREGSKRTRMAARPIVFFIFFLLRPILSKIYAKMGLARQQGPSWARLCPKGVNCHLFRGFPLRIVYISQGKTVVKKGSGKLGRVRPKDAHFSRREKSAPCPRFALLSASREEPCPLRCGGLSDGLSLASLFSTERATTPVQSSTDFLIHTLRLG